MQSRKVKGEVLDARAASTQTSGLRTDVATSTGQFESLGSPSREQFVQAAADGSARARQTEALQRMADTFSNSAVQLKNGNKKKNEKNRNNQDGKDDKKEGNKKERQPIVEIKKYLSQMQDISGMTLYFGYWKAPSVVMQDGVDWSTGKYTSIIVHLMNGGRDSKWVSTTTDFDVAKGFASSTGYIYELNNVQSRGLNADNAYEAYHGDKDEKSDMNWAAPGQKIGSNYAHKGQYEISVWNKIAPTEVTGVYLQVKGAWQYFSRAQVLSPNNIAPEIRERF